MNLNMGNISTKNKYSECSLMITCIGYNRVMLWLSNSLTLDFTKELHKYDQEMCIYTEGKKFSNLLWGFIV